MILVDSSIWIAYFRKQTTSQTSKLVQAKAVRQLLVADLVMLELLQGARDEAHAQQLETELRTFPLVEVLDERIATTAARNYRFLRGQGYTIRKSSDLIIATFCMVEGHALLHNDRDFDPIEKMLGLRVA